MDVSVIRHDAMRCFVRRHLRALGHLLVGSALCFAPGLSGLEPCEEPRQSIAFNLVSDLDFLFDEPILCGFGDGDALFDPIVDAMFRGFDSTQHDHPENVPLLDLDPPR